MTTTELRKQIKQKVDELPDEQLEAAATLLEDLIDEEDATEELEKIPGFAEAVEEGLKAIDEGRATPVVQLRRRS